MVTGWGLLRTRQHSLKRLLVLSLACCVARCPCLGWPHRVESIATAVLTERALIALTDFILLLYTHPRGVALLNTKIQEYVVKLQGRGASLPTLG